MIMNYNANNIPDSLYGGTYEDFKVEISNSRPLYIYLTDATSGEQYIINGLDRIHFEGWERPTTYGYPSSREELVFLPIGSKKELRKKLELAKEYHDNEIKKIKDDCNTIVRNKVDKYGRRLFILFLKTITIRTEPNGSSKSDIDFINEYYGVELNLEDKS